MHVLQKCVPVIPKKYWQKGFCQSFFWYYTKLFCTLQKLYGLVVVIPQEESVGPCLEILLLV